MVSELFLYIFVWPVLTGTLIYILFEVADHERP